MCDSTTLLLGNLSSPFLRSHSGMHCATQRMNLRCFLQNGSAACPGLHGGFFSCAFPADGTIGIYFSFALNGATLPLRWQSSSPLLALFPLNTDCVLSLGIDGCVTGFGVPPTDLTLPSTFPARFGCSSSFSVLRDAMNANIYLPVESRRDGVLAVLDNISVTT